VAPTARHLVILPVHQGVVYPAPAKGVFRLAGAHVGHRDPTEREDTGRVVIFYAREPFTFYGAESVPVHRPTEE